MHSQVIAASRWSDTDFGYDAVLPKNKRQPPTGILRSEDAELLPESRRKLVSGTRDLHRNFALVAWMVRRHLDYITTFEFQANSGRDSLDDKLESFVKSWSKRDACDVAARHTLQRIIRLSELRRTVDGDIFILRLTDGRMQAIEGDRIRTPMGGDLPPGLDLSAMIHGVMCNDAGRALAYAVCRREGLAGSSRFEFERMLAAENVYHHAYFDRFDQVRGVSPLASAYNSLRDVYEGFDYALAKMKVSQLFALAFYREASEPLGVISDGSGEGEEVDGTGYKVDFGRGPAMLDLLPGDRAEFLESKTPSTEMQAFAQATIQLALCALDIPYSFYSENFTNYSGARQAWLQYEQSADIKRNDTRDLLDYFTAWRIRLAVQDGELPSTALNAAWQWESRGIPWIDPLKEVQGELAAIGAALDNPEDIAIRHGKNVYENIDKIKRVKEYADKAGVELVLDPKNLLPESAAPEMEPTNGNGQPK